VNAIIEERDGNEFLYEKGGLHFGCHRRFVLEEDEGCVVCEPDENSLDGEGIKQLRKELKFTRLHISALNAEELLSEGVFP